MMTAWTGVQRMADVPNVGSRKCTVNLSGSLCMIGLAATLLLCYSGALWYFIAAAHQIWRLCYDINQLPRPTHTGQRFLAVTHPILHVFYPSGEKEARGVAATCQCCI